MKISIVMTAYNIENYISEAINSCLNQTYKDIELIIVEDCSTDKTKEIVQEYEKKYPIKVIYHEENLGAGIGRRHGIEAATGDYFITIDGDDWIDPTFIESLANKAIETGSDIVSGGITVERGNGYWESTCYGNLIIEDKHEQVLKFWGEKIVFMNNKIIRRTLGDMIPYCQRRFIEDTPVIVPMLWLANKVAYVENTGYHYRMLETSLTHQADPFKYALYRALCMQDLIDFFKTNDIELFNKIPFTQTLQEQLDIIKSVKNKPIYKYLDAWIEFTTRIFS